MNPNRNWKEWFVSSGWWQSSVLALACSAVLFIASGPQLGSAFAQEGDPGCDSYLPCDTGLDCCDGVCFDPVNSCCCDGEIIAVEDCVCGGGFCTP